MSDSESPYALAAPRLLERGISVIPIAPGEKRPGQFKAGEWVGMSDWQRFCARQPSNFETQIWLDWPDAGICIALGNASGLSAIDIDYASPEVQAVIETILPPSPVKKKGSKGYTAFYRGAKLPSRKWTIGGASVIELLSHGRQTVIPPTIHPDGMPYKWLTPDTLDDYPIKDLPELPADFIERITEALEPFQTADDLRPTDRPKWERRDDEPASLWREVNDRAMADFSWVPALFPHAKPRADGSYRVIAHWRNVEKPNVSIHPMGITDWGEGRNYTPIDLVMASEGMTLDAATEWLRDAIGMPKPVVSTAALVNQAPGMRVSLPEGHDDADSDYEAPALPGEPEGLPEPAQPDLASFRPPGAFDLTGGLKLLYDYMISTSIVPQPMFCLAAAISTIGALAGRRYVGPTGLMSNIYTVAIGDSGSGKNYPFVAVQQVLVAAGLSRFLGGSDVASGQAFVSALQRQPAILFMLDEFGMLLQSISDRQRAPRHAVDIIDKLTKLYSQAQSVYLGTEYANQTEKPRVEIQYPCLSLFGASAPHHFWKALQSGSVVDGSLARMLVFITEDDYPDPNDSPASREPSTELLTSLRDIAGGGSLGKGNLAGITSSPQTPVKPMEVAWTPAAQWLFKDLMASTLEAKRESRGTLRTPMLARRDEHALKLAMIAAVSKSPVFPLITEDEIYWAGGLATALVDQMNHMVERKVADNQTEANHKKVLEIIRSYARNGVSRRELTRATQWLGVRQRDEILNALMEAGQITQGASASSEQGGRKRITYRAA